MQAGEIKRVEEILAYSHPENPWLKLYFDRVEFPGGAIGRYNRIVECEGRNGVAILPLYSFFVGLVRQFRYPVGSFLWEIPRGFGGDNGTARQALKELSEETGIHVGPERLVNLGTIYPNSGLLASEVQLFAVLVESCGQDTPSRADSEPTDFH